MKRIVLGTVFWLLAALPSFTGFGPALAAGGTSIPPREMIMHRSQAGEPDATGWSLARSTRGEFSVMLPGRFDDFTLQGTAPDGVPILSDILRAGSGDGVRFSAFRVVRKDGTLPDGTMDKIVEKYRQKSFYFKKDKVNYQGMEGYEILARSDSFGAVIRVFRMGGRLYELIVEYPPELESLMAPDVTRFLESFAPR